MIPQNILQKAQQRWQDSAGKRNAHLLRLAILRELSLGIHAAISHRLTEGNSAEARRFEHLEDLLEQFPSLHRLEDRSLDELLHSQAVPGNQVPETRPSDKLLSRIGAAKLIRQDRNWERLLVTEAEQLNWAIWQVQAELPLEGLEKWNTGFQEALWPEGILLFVESAEPAFPEFSATAVPKTWFGQWTILCNPGDTDPAVLWNPLFPNGKTEYRLSQPRWTRIHPL